MDPIRNQGRTTVTAMAATQVAHTTIMLDRWCSFFSLSSLSVISSWSSQGSLVNSSTSTSYRNLTLEDSRRQKRWPESRRSRHQIGSCGGMAEIVIVSMKLQNRDWSIKVRLLQNRATAAAIFVLFNRYRFLNFPRIRLSLMMRQLFILPSSTFGFLLLSLLIANSLFYAVAKKKGTIHNIQPHTR